MFFPLLLIPLGLVAAAATADALNQPKRVILRPGKSYQFTFEIETSGDISAQEREHIAAGLIQMLGYRDVLITKGDPLLIYVTEDVRRARAVTVPTTEAFTFEGRQVRLVLREVSEA